MMETRKSMARPLYFTRKRPSWGTRRSEMSSSLITLIRERRGEGFLHARGCVFADDGETLAGFFQNALRLFRLLQDVADLLDGGDFRDNALLKQQADLVDHHQLAGIGDGDGQAAVGRFFEGNEVVAEHQLDGDLFEEFVMQLEVGEVNEFAAIEAGNGPR